MTPSELKSKVNTTGSHFFDRDTMKFFGDTMKNYGVRTTTIQTSYDFMDVYHEEPITVEVWELFRKRSVKHGVNKSTHFCKVTFEVVYPKGE